MIKVSVLALILGAAVNFSYCAPVAAQQAEESVSTALPDPKSLQLNEEGAAAVTGKDYAKAERLFRQALSVDPYNLTAVYNLSGLHAMMNRNQEAEGLLKDYLKKAPADAGLLARLADVYFATERPKDAADYYEKALAQSPKYPKLQARLATVYLLLKRTEDAEKMYIAAVKEEPNDYELYENLSGIQLANGKYQEAIGTAKKALQMRVSSDVYITLATAYELSGNKKNALIAYQRALDLGDERPELKQKIEELKK